MMVVMLVSPHGEVITVCARCRPQLNPAGIRRLDSRGEEFEEVGFLPEPGRCAMCGANEQKEVV